MCKFRDPFFYTGVIIRARCARYYEAILSGKDYKFMLDIHALTFLQRITPTATRNIHC